MDAYEVVTARDLGRYYELFEALDRADEQQFLGFDWAVARYWDDLPTTFPDYQFCLVERESGATVGVGNCIPLSFAGEWAELPHEGLDWALERGFLDMAAGHRPNMVSALYIEIAGSRRGQRLSSRMLSVMRGIVGEHGFRQLIAPVRPSRKDRYPLLSMEEYLQRRTPEGLPYDPWLRVHVRAGGRVLHPCLRAMRVEGTRADWANWTGLSFSGDGDFVIPYGLVPLSLQGERGLYVEPGIWVRHDL